MPDNSQPPVSPQLARHALAIVGGIALLAGGVLWLPRALSGGSSSPPAAPAASAPTTPAPAADLASPRAGDLTLAQPAGEILVGLTVRPGEPGPNDLLLYLVPLMGEDTAGPLEATLDVGGESLTAEECGTTCRQASAELGGGETISVTLTGMPEDMLGGTATFTLPELPAADGQELLARSTERMGQLDSVAIDETLAYGRGATEAAYQLQAPDRLLIDITGGGQTRIIGDTRYRRETADGPWESEPGPTTQTPTFTWDNFQPWVAPRIVGNQDVDGQPTTIVAFAGPPESLPVWFQLWIDSEGLVRRAAMHAQGHFMHHRYHSFDQPMDITPPPLS
jgi:hypothetical protein